MTPSDRLRQLATDWDRYETMLHDLETRHSMQRAVVVEMEVELAKLKEHCQFHSAHPHNSLLARLFGSKIVTMWDPY